MNREEAERKFPIGSIVQVKHIENLIGEVPPLMVVTEYALNGYREEVSVSCKWFDNNNQSDFADWPPEALKVIKRSKVSAQVEHDDPDLDDDDQDDDDDDSDDDDGDTDDD